MAGAQRQWCIKHYSATGTYGPRSVSGSHHYCGCTFLLGVWLPQAGATWVPVCQPGMCALCKTCLACTWGQTAIKWFRKPRWLFFHFFLAIHGLSLLNNFLINKYSNSSRRKDIYNCQIRTITSLFNQPQFLYIYRWNNMRILNPPVYAALSAGFLWLSQNIIYCTMLLEILCPYLEGEGEWRVRG